MTDIATLALAVDSTQVDKGGKSLDDLAAKGAKAEEATKKLTSATDVLANAAKAAAAAFGAFKVAQFVQDATMLAARYETMGVVMRIAGNNAGYTAAQMDEYSKALQRSGISMLQSRNSLTQLATANIALANAAKLGRAAQDLAVVGNINSSEALGRMIHGIKSGEVEILRSIGLNVNFEAGYKRLAASLGTTSDKLTEQQKVQSRTSAALAEATKYQGIYEESLTTAGKALGSLTRYWEDFKVKAGDAFLPTLAAGVFAVTDVLKDMNAALDTAAGDGTISAVADAFKGTFRTALETVAVLGANVAFVIQGIGRSIGGLMALIAAPTPTAATSIWKQMGEDSDNARAKLDAFEKKMLGGAPAIVSASKMSEDARIAAGAASRAQAEADDKAAKALEEAAKASKKTAAEYHTLVKSIQEKIAAQQIEIALGEDATAGQKEYQKLLTDVTGGYLKLKPVEIARLAALHDQIMTNERLIESEKDRIKWEKSLSDEASATHTSWMDEHRESLDATQKEIAAQQEYNLTAGMSKESLAVLADARYADAIASKERELAAIAGTKADADQITVIKAEIEALRTLRGLKVLGVQKDIAIDAAKKAAEEWRRTAETVERSLTDALTRGFESGKGLLENLRDTAVNMFKTLVLRPVIQGVVQGGMSAVGLGASGLASAAGATGSGGGGLVGSIGLLSQAKSAYDMITGGAANTYNSMATSTIGQQLGLSSTTTIPGYTAAEASGMMSGVRSGSLVGGQQATLTTLGKDIGTGLATAGAGIIGSSIGNAIAGDKRVIKGISGAQVGATVGAFWGPLGAGIGGVIGGVVDAAFGMGAKKRGATGMEGTFAGTSFAGQTYSEWSQEGGWFRSNKSGRDTSAIGDEQSRALGASFTLLKLETGKLAQSLGVDTASIASYTKTINVAMGEDAAANNKAVADMFGTLSDDLSKLALAGSNFGLSGETSSQTLDRLSSSLLTVNDAFANINMSAYAVSLAGGDMASKLVQAMGGLDAFKTSVGSYYDNYFSDAEKLADAGARLQQSFAALGRVMPASNDEFRKLVETYPESFAGLMALNGAFAQFTTATDAAAKATADAAASAAKATADAAKATADAAAEAMKVEAEARATYIATYTDAIAAAQGKLASSYKVELDLKNALAVSMRGYATSLKDLRSSLMLGAQSPLSPQQQYTETRKRLEDLQRRAALGDKTAFEKIQPAVQDFLSASRTNNASGDQYTQDFGWVQSLLNDSQTTADRIATAQESNAYDLQAQIAILDNTYTATLSVADAVRAMQDAVVSALQAGVGLNALPKGVEGAFPGATGQWNATSSGGSYYRSAAGAGALRAAGASTGTIYGINGQQISEQDAVKWVNEQVGAGTLRDIYNNAKKFGVSLSDMDKLMGWEPETAEDWAASQRLPSFDVGTNVVPFDMVARVHKDEEIKPARYVDRERSERAETNALLREVIVCLSNEVSKLRAEQAAQHSESVAANFEANDLAATKVVKGQQATAWRDQNVPKYAA